MRRIIAAGPAAADGVSLRYRVDADADRHVATLRRTASSSKECVFWVGDPKNAEHRTVRVQAGGSAEVSGDDFGAQFCAQALESRMSWPDCTTAANAGALNVSHTGEYLFW